MPSQPVGFDRMDPTCSTCSEPRWNFCAICGGSLGTLASIEHRPRPRLSRWSRWPSARALGAESRLAGDGRHRDDAASPSAVAVVAERPESLPSSSPWWWWPSSRPGSPVAMEAIEPRPSSSASSRPGSPVVVAAIEPCLRSSRASSRQPHPIAWRWWSSRPRPRRHRAAPASPDRVAVAQPGSLTSSSRSAPSSRCSRPLAVVEPMRFSPRGASVGRSGGAEYRWSAAS